MEHTTTWKAYDSLRHTLSQMGEHLTIMQAVMGLGYMYDSELYGDYISLRNKLRRMRKTLNIKRRTI